MAIVTKLWGPDMCRACQGSKDTSRVGRWGNFLCLLWQHCRRPWSSTCEPCSFDSGRSGFVWVRRVWNGSTDPKSRQIRGAFRHTISQRKRWTSSGNSQTNCCFLWQRYDFHLFLHVKKRPAGKKFDNDDELQEEVMTWFIGQAADFYDSEIYKLVPKLNKCLDNAGDCVEK